MASRSARRTGPDSLPREMDRCRRHGRPDDVAALRGINVDSSEQTKYRRQRMKIVRIYGIGVRVPKTSSSTLHHSCASPLLT